jgi:hypothetical protein
VSAAVDQPDRHGRDLAALGGQRDPAGRGQPCLGVVRARRRVVAVICGGGPVVSVSASPVTIRAVTVTGGHAAVNVGRILNTGTLTVEDASIGPNAAGGDGGGIANSGRTAMPRR